MLLEELTGSFGPPMCGASYALTMTSGRCESRKLYRTKQLGAWTGNFRNVEIFGKVDAGEGFGRLN